MAADPSNVLKGTNGSLALLNTTLNATLDAIQKRIAHITRQETVFFGRELTEEELLAIQKRVEFEFEHRGHESEHSTMALILLGSLFVSQIAISAWKRNSPRSYNTATLLGLWLVPFFLGLSSGYWRFVIVHVIFSIANGWIVYKALESPIRSWVPRTVYSWYAWVYAVSYSVGALGYFVILLAFFHVPAMITGATIEAEAHIFEAGLITLFYGLYFGTLGRDFVDRLSDRMATSMGYYSQTGFPSRHLQTNMCAICGESTEGIGREGLHVLECNHSFHPVCIRGWTIIGKKDMCPNCKEKVDLKAFKTNPWDTAQILYLNLLDALRYLLVWNPLVFLVVHFVFKLFGFH